MYLFIYYLFITVFIPGAFSQLSGFQIGLVHKSYKKNVIPLKL